MKKQYYIIIVFALLVIGGVFYWFELRPYFGKRECYKVAENLRQMDIGLDIYYLEHGITTTDRDDSNKYFNDDYNTCLMEKGLKQ
ncbi:MAG: hypothetical protein WCK10_01725 [Candidatus Staskawiczbacteria bacterium]